MDMDGSKPQWAYEDTGETHEARSYECISLLSILLNTPEWYKVCSGDSSSITSKSMELGGESSNFSHLPKNHSSYTAAYRASIRVLASRGSEQRTSSPLKIEIPATTTVRLLPTVLKPRQDANRDLPPVLVLVLAAHARSTIVAPSLAW